MKLTKHSVRRVLLAALILLPLSLPVSAEVEARYEGGLLVVNGLDADMRLDIVQNPETVLLQVSGLASRNGMPVSVRADGATILIEPRFDLRPGTDYALRLGDAIDLFIALPEPEAKTPRLLTFEPSQSVIPENTLRMYLQFSEPMARGQVRDRIRLFTKDGTEVPSPFLALGPELWDPSQSRVTLLLDPGRIKQGVGPNTELGAPLTEGDGYELVVDAEMESAAGEPLGQATAIAFRAGPAERRPIEPANWQVLVPPAGGNVPISISFERIMDTGAARRLITLRDPQGVPIQGQIETDGGGWSLSPNAVWNPGIYTLEVDAELEDVAGNTPGVPFDATVGTIGTIQEATIIEIEIGG